MNNSLKRPLRVILLLLALLTSPLIFCGTIQFLDMLPTSILPGGLDFTLNLFETEARVENHTSETFYLTPITTTYGRPDVIPQNVSFQQRNIPLAPNGSVLLKYDSADMPLSGIAVCRAEEDCRLLAVDYSGAYVLDSYESLPSLEPSWLAAIQSHPLHNYNNLIIPALSLLPILLFSGWLYVGRLETRQAG
jgi:hypothetical protein